MRLLLSSGLVWLALGAANAQPAQVERIDVVEFGIYTLDRKVDSVNAAGIKQSATTNIRLAAQTRIIPLQKNVSFGYRYKIVGKPKGAPVELRRVTIFPSPGVRPPSSSKLIERSERMLKRSIGETGHTSYMLEDDFELVPGTWTLEIYVGQRKLVSQAFTVTKP